MFRKTIYLQLILLTVGIGFLTACQSDGSEPVNGAEMVFTTNVLSRTSCIDNTNLTQHPFAVYGDFYNLDDSDIDIEDRDFIKPYNGTVVKYDASLNKWTYDDLRYWFSGYQYAFVAKMPDKTISVSAIKYNKGLFKFTYNQPSSYDTAEDVLIATHRRNFIGGHPDAVRLQFAHILSKINIGVKYIDPFVDENYPLYITGFVFEDIPTSANYAVEPAPLSGNSNMTDDAIYPDGEEGWDINRTNDYTVKFPANALPSGDAITNDGKVHQVFTDDRALLLLPCPDEDINITINYTTYNYQTKQRDEKTATVTVPGGWKAGQTLNLTLTFVNNSVKLDYEVAPWEENTIIDTTVPRK